MNRLIISCQFCILLSLFSSSAFPQSQKTQPNLFPPDIGLKIDGHAVVQQSETSQNFWQEVYPLIYIDTLFRVENLGMDRITVGLDGFIFKLTIHPSEVNLGDNVFLMPDSGVLILNIGKYINPSPGQETIIRLNYQGQVGDTAHILIGDLLLPGEEVDFILELVEVPDNLRISQNFPNPFNEFTNITFTIPDIWLNGAEVELSIYTVLGQKVRALFRGRRLYGDFTVKWDGRNDQGIPVASGVYLYRISARDQQITKRMLFIK